MPRAKKPTTPPEQDFAKVAYVVPALPGVRPCPFCKGRVNINVHVNVPGTAFCARLSCPDCLLSGPLPRLPDATGALAASRAVKVWDGMLNGTHNVCGASFTPADIPAWKDL